MDSTAAVNPTFSSFNRAILWYCDGASFSGDRTAPYHHKSTNQTLYFRGRRVLELLIDELIERRGLGDATDVLVAGGSAGGLATFLHADRVAELLRIAACRSEGSRPCRCRASSSCTTTARGADVARPDEVCRHDAERDRRAQPRVRRRAAGGGVAVHLCQLLVRVLGDADVPAAVNLRLVAARQHLARRRVDCGASNFENCTRAAVDRLNAYRASMLADLHGARGKSQRPGEGGFVETCYEHVAAQGARFDRYALRGVVERDALGKWWDAPATAPRPSTGTCRAS